MGAKSGSLKQRQRYEGRGTGAKAAAAGQRAVPSGWRGDDAPREAPRPPLREEYPGPQTASTGEHVESGQTKPTKTRRAKQ
jgi:hypothetical protein